MELRGFHRARHVAPMNKKTRKVLFTVLVMGVVATLATAGTFAAFSSTTTSTGNVFATGTVILSSNSAGGAIYNVSTAKPGTSDTHCIHVSYTGSLAAAVHLYSSAVTDPPASDITLTIQPGSGLSGAFNTCTGFTPAGPALYSGSLATFAGTYTNFGTGLATGGTWTSGTSVDYQFTVTLSAGAGNGDQGTTTGNHSFTWEAQNT